MVPNLMLDGTKVPSVERARPLRQKLDTLIWVYEGKVSSAVKGQCTMY